MIQNVLVVQHDHAVFADAVDALTADGLTVASLNTVCLSDFLLRWSGAAFDGLLLDAALNCGGAADLCAKLRGDGFHGAIMVFGAAPSEDTVVACLDAGADDVLDMTLGQRELVARVRASLPCPIMRTAPRRVAMAQAA